MPRSVLFGYVIEAEDGKLTVSISGPMAARMLEQLGSRRHRHGGGAFGSPFGWLGSAAVSLVPLLRGEEMVEDCSEGEVAREDLSAIFGQGFDSTYGEFRERLDLYRALIEGENEERGEGAADASRAQDGGEETKPLGRRQRVSPADSTKD
jgi:hypothetical protein